MSGRTRNMAADAAHLAGLGAGPSGSASGHRAHRRLRAEQGRAASGALNGRAFGLGAAQVGLTLSLPHSHGRFGQKQVATSMGEKTKQEQEQFSKERQDREQSESPKLSGPPAYLR